MYFCVKFSDLKALFPLVYFMQNRDDRFQDCLGKVKLNNRSALSNGNWASWPISNFVLNKLCCANKGKMFLSQQKLSTWVVALGCWICMSHLNIWPCQNC